MAITILSVVVLTILLVFMFIKKIETTQVLIKSAIWSKRYKVCTGSALVLPICHRARFVDLKTKKIVLDLVEHESLRCRDGIRVEIKVEFVVRVNKTERDILWVAEKLGCSQSFDNIAVEDFLKNTFLDAVKSVTAKMEFDDLRKNTDKLKNGVLAQLKGENTAEKNEQTNEIVVFEGYQIRDMLIIEFDMLDNVDAYNVKNISDVEGRKKITQITDKK
jgi:uncharacterized membrane protein YqiK